MPGWFRLDRTEGQKHALYVAAEKDTLRRQLTGWLAHTGIMVVCGFGSQPYVDVVRDRVAAARREAVLLVVTSTAPERTSNVTDSAHRLLEPHAAFPAHLRPGRPRCRHRHCYSPPAIWRARLES